MITKKFHPQADNINTSFTLLSKYHFMELKIGSMQVFKVWVEV